MFSEVLGKGLVAQKRLIPNPPFLVRSRVLGKASTGQKVEILPLGS